MAHIIADRVRESTTTTGTTDFALNGAVTDFLGFSSVMANGDTCWYAAILAAGGGWEVGIGTFSSPSTLQRTTILASSNAGAKVAFGAGAKDLFMDFPASAMGLHGLTAKTTPVDADEISLWDSVASRLSKLTWANLKTTLKATTAQFLANVSGLFLTTDQVWAAGATLAATSQADATVTMTIASPGVVTDTAHGMTGNEPFHFTTTGALPTGVTANTEYYVLAAGLTTNTYQFAATRGGTAIVTTGSQSGTHTRVRRVLLDGNLSSNWTLTASRNFTLAKPYNWKAGQSGRFTVTQDGTGSRTMTYGNQAAGGWGVAGTTAIALSTAASAKDKIWIDAESSTDVVLTAGKAIA